MKSLIIRKAALSDFQSILELVKQIQELHVNARPDLYTQTDKPIDNQYFNDLLEKENHFAFIVEDSQIGKIIGYTIFRIETLVDSPIMKERKTLFMNELVIDKSFRGKGIGKKLFDFVVNMGKKLEVNSIDLSVAEFNQSAINFYKNAGMKIRSRRLEYIYN